MISHGAYLELFVDDVVAKALPVQVAVLVERVLGAGADLLEFRHSKPVDRFHPAQVNRVSQVSESVTS